MEQSLTQDESWAVSGHNPGELARLKIIPSEFWNYEGWEASIWSHALAGQDTSTDVALECLIIFNVFALKVGAFRSFTGTETKD